MKTWETPKLIALVRGKPEETVLGLCKSTFLLAGPQFAVSMCWSLSDAVACWLQCSALADS